MFIEWIMAGKEWKLTWIQYMQQSSGKGATWIRYTRSMLFVIVHNLIYFDWIMEACAHEPSGYAQSFRLDSADHWGREPPIESDHI